jgi:hypothetical protein
MLILFLDAGTLGNWAYFENFQYPYPFHPQGAEIATSLFLKFRAYIFLFYFDRFKTISLRFFSQKTG